MTTALEQTIALHCAPALAGIKPANLVSIRKHADVDAQIHAMNLQMSARGIRIERIGATARRCILLVYRTKKLKAHLSQPEASAFLNVCGYPVAGEALAAVEYLKQRIKTCRTFPHEIGVFLGYPIDDIKGFMEGKPCLMSGYWKVYADPEKAKRLFARYMKCREAVYRRVARGESLGAVFG